MQQVHSPVAVGQVYALQQHAAGEFGVVNIDQSAAVIQGLADLEIERRQRFGLVLARGHQLGFGLRGERVQQAIAPGLAAGQEDDAMLV